MDNLPIETTAKILNFLPWKDKLASRQLSSKFERLLVSNPIKAETLSIEQTPTTLSVSLGINCETGSGHMVESRTIRVRNDARGRSETSSKKLSELTINRIQHVKETKIDGEIGKAIETIVECDDKNFRDGNSRLAAEVCMRPFVTYFSYEILQLITLDNHFLSNLLAIFVEVRPDFANNSEMSLCLGTNHSQMSEGERELLTLFKNLNLFKFRAPPTFEVPLYFWNLPCIRNAKELVILFGTPDSSGNFEPVNVDLGVDDWLLGNFIAEKRILFQSNATSGITANLLIHYISECLCGGYTMEEISIAHSLNLEELGRIESYLKDSGFISQSSKYYGMYWKQQTIDGHPHPLILHLSDRDLSIWSDLV